MATMVKKQIVLFLMLFTLNETHEMYSWSAVEMLLLQLVFDIENFFVCTMS